MMRASVAFVLHAHLPFVDAGAEGDSIESRWLLEAIADCYVPILDLLGSLEMNDRRARLTVSLSPPLASMLRDPALPQRYATHAARLEGLLGDAFTCSGEGALDTACDAARAHLVNGAERFLAHYAGDLVGAMARLAQAGRIELITTAATHAVLPLLTSDPTWLAAELSLGLGLHARRCGSTPSGFWLPECAYDPVLDAFLQRAGIRYAVVDQHAVTRASPRPQLAPHAPVATRAGLVVLPRDATGALRVWNARVGYPADPRYRDYFRDLGRALPAHVAGRVPLPAGGAPLGIKLYAIRGSVYDPVEAQAQAHHHARHFVDDLALRAAEYTVTTGHAPTFVEAFDAELFGHWWFEGPQWLAAVLSLLDHHPSLEACTLSAALERTPVVEQVDVAASTWGAGGHLQTWLDPSTAAARAETVRLASVLAATDATRAHPGTAAAAIRHLLQAYASDWPFMIHHDTARPYGHHRLELHLSATQRLVGALARGVAGAPSDIRSHAGAPGPETADDVRSILSRAPRIP